MISSFDSSPNELFHLDPIRLDESLEQIEQDPFGVLVGQTGVAFLREDPGLAHIIKIAQRNMGQAPREAYVESALLTRKLIGDAGVPKGTTLPRMSQAGIVEFAQIASSALERPRVSNDISVAFNSAFGPLLDQEPSVKKVISDLGRYRLGRDGFYAGAAMMVAGLRFSALDMQ